MTKNRSFKFTFALIAVALAMFFLAGCASDGSGLIPAAATASPTTASPITVAGPVGPVGPAGPVGPVGPAGPQGPAGKDGKDATTPAQAPAAAPVAAPVTVNQTVSVVVNGGGGGSYSPSEIAQGCTQGWITDPALCGTKPVVINPTAAAPVQPVVSSAEVCRLDKVNTANEMVGIDFQRIEVGGHHVQHVDFYPRKGVKSVSYIVNAITPLQAPAIWLGFGSIFEATDAPSCGTFDWVADATVYAGARLDSGHSGLVVDLRSGTPVVVTNVAGLSTDQINALLKQHTDLRSDKTAAALPTTGSCKATTTAHSPVVGSAWTITGPSIVNFWTNEPNQNQAEQKLLVPAGTTAKLLGGGTSYSFPTGCSMDVEFAANTLPATTLDQLTALGLLVK